MSNDLRDMTAQLNDYVSFLFESGKIGEPQVEFAVTAMASYMRLCELNDEPLDVSTRENNRILCRTLVIQCLAMENHWHGAWIELIDAVLPGPAPTQKQIDEFVFLAAVQIVTKYQRQLKLEDQASFLSLYLLVRGYRTNESDMALLICLCQKVENWSTFGESMSRETYEEVQEELMSEISRRASKHLHPAWTSVVARLLTPLASD